MSTDPRCGPGLGDLEKELTCSICTELLYQPLTLLDCLHTFCGYCLKEWFHTQGSRRSSSSSSSPRYTCPSCRASVRETRPNATVTTLLDMVLTANPDRAKPAEERTEIEQRYKPGESVFPPVAAPQHSSAESDEDDHALLEEVRQLSLQESRAQTRTAAHRTRQSSRTRRTGTSESDGQRRDDGRSRRRRDEERAARRQRTVRPTTTGRPEDTAERTRSVEHQSSLRSLLSLSDTETMEEEILRQILEERLLDDIDLDNLGPGQEEELSERIADAYRRRHRLRSRSQQRQAAAELPQGRGQTHARSQSLQGPQISASQETSDPLTTRPSLLEPPAPRPGASSHQRHLSEQGSNRRRRTSPVPIHPASSSDVALGPAVRSSSDIIPNRPRNFHSRAETTDSNTPRSQRATSSEQGVPNMLIDGARDRPPSHARARSSTDSPRATTAAARSSLVSSISTRPRNGASELSTTSSLVAEVNGPARQERPRPSSSRSNAPGQPVSLYPEPSISCDRCGKLNIQYDLHKTCPQCKDGNYHLCLRCYRLGRGCLEWKGFGAAAEADSERMRASSIDQSSRLREPQHILRSFRYTRPSETAHRSLRDGKEMTSDNPARRLQQGFFCDRCQSPANECFWKCNQCNEGDWGFCNKCVNQGKCCTHPLLPICRVGPSTRSSPDRSSTDGTIDTFKILSISTRCDICACPVPASTLRFHCLRCNHGDYDICANCYLRLVATSKIRKGDGHNGWRRCPKGHRMVVVGFEDNHPEGHRRVVIHNLVGGHALNDNHLLPLTAQAPPNPGGTPGPEFTSPGVGDWSWKEGPERRKKASRIRTPWTTERERERDRPSNPDPSTPSPTSSSTPIPQSPSSSRRYPPDGGVGLIVHALWSWYPEEGVTDELMFPRGAEITEAENINDDWYWGCYAGMTGLFPGSHVVVVGEVV